MHRHPVAVHTCIAGSIASDPPSLSDQVALPDQFVDARLDAAAVPLGVEDELAPPFGSAYVLISIVSHEIRGDDLVQYAEDVIGLAYLVEPADQLEVLLDRHNDSFV